MILGKALLSLASLRFSWAWHSSVPAFFVIFFKYGHVLTCFWLLCWHAGSNQAACSYKIGCSQFSIFITFVSDRSFYEKRSARKHFWLLWSSWKFACSCKIGCWLVKKEERKMRVKLMATSKPSWPLGLGLGLGLGWPKINAGMVHMLFTVVLFSWLYANRYSD